MDSSAAPASPPLIALEHFHLSLGAARQPLLKDIHLSLRGGDFALVLGPAGSGKSLLLRLLAGLLPVQPGQVSWQGQARSPQVWRSQVAWLPTQPRLLAGPVAEALAYPLGLRGLSSLQIEARLAPWLEALEIPADWLGKTAQGLGQGASQRLALVRALALAPRLLLLDDPWPAEPSGEGLGELPIELALALAQCRRLADPPAIVWARRSPQPITAATWLGRLDHGRLTAWTSATPAAWHQAQQSWARVSQDSADEDWDGDDPAAMHG